MCCIHRLGPFIDVLQRSVWTLLYLHFINFKIYLKNYILESEQNLIQDDDKEGDDDDIDVVKVLL
jgi:hypothetical protein